MEFVVILEGHDVKVGCCVSFTVTVNEQVPPPIDEVTFTVAVPIENTLPDAIE